MLNLVRLLYSDRMNNYNLRIQTKTKMRFKLKDQLTDRINYYF
jgi:hypothetical protein